MDTILTSKSQLCQRQQIQLKVVADGVILNHLHVMDLATIFGNALDNAIEHVMQIPDTERRLIRVSVSLRGNMACILVENYFEGTLRQTREGFLTTKTDARYHGYGLYTVCSGKIRRYFQCGRGRRMVQGKDRPSGSIRAGFP